MVEAATPGSFILVVRGVAGQLVKVQWGGMAGNVLRESSR